MADGNDKVKAAIAAAEAAAKTGAARKKSDGPAKYNQPTARPDDRLKDALRSWLEKESVSFSCGDNIAWATILVGAKLLKQEVADAIIADAKAGRAVGGGGGAKAKVAEQAAEIEALKAEVAKLLASQKK
jgi:hypothetical protein